MPPSGIPTVSLLLKKGWSGVHHQRTPSPWLVRLVKSTRETSFPGFVLERSPKRPSLGGRI